MFFPVLTLDPQRIDVLSMKRDPYYFWLSQAADPARALNLRNRLCAKGTRYELRARRQFAESAKELLVVARETAASRLPTDTRRALYREKRSLGERNVSEWTPARSRGVQSEASQCQ